MLKTRLHIKSKCLAALFLFGAIITPFTPTADGAVVNSGHVEAELVSEVQSIKPGVSLWVALRMKMDPHWHTYWVYGGDAGLRTKIKWVLPPGFEASEILWPYPQWIEIAGLANFGYEGEVFLLTEITPPASLEIGSTVSLAARGDWLVCEESCIPEHAELELTLPVVQAEPVKDPTWTRAFADTRERLPHTFAAWELIAQRSGQGIRVRAMSGAGAIEDPGKVIFFPEEENAFQLVNGQTWQQVSDGYALDLKTSILREDPVTHVRGILVSEKGWVGADTRKSMRVDIAISEAGLAGEGPSDEVVSVGAHLKILLLAFVGGLILNLMPCVFPVLGLKIMGFVQQAGEEPRKAKLHGLLFSLGVVLSFWVLAGVLVVIRAGGQELGWGFQLQSPLFVFAIAVILFVFALSLSGLFEFGLSMTAVGGGLASRSGLSGSFFSGALATLVATPCAAPFLAPALGAALAMEPAESFVVFTAIALGLASPYLVLSAFPSLLRYMPRPGAWMETFKQGMAFMLYATVAYLVWVLEGQLDEKGLLTVLFAFVFIALAAWVYGRWSTTARKPRVRAVGRSLAALILVSGLYMGYAAQKPSDFKWEAWSQGRVEELLAAGRPVYVDFTARWCATCQVNKRVALGAPDVIRAFRSHDVAALKADWTNQDPEITKTLAQFGRSAVPFNVLYIPGRPEPVTLPELLTPQMVLDALSHIE